MAEGNPFSQGPPPVPVVANTGPPVPPVQPEASYDTYDADGSYETYGTENNRPVPVPVQGSNKPIAPPPRGDEYGDSGFDADGAYGSGDTGLKKVAPPPRPPASDTKESPPPEHSLEISGGEPEKQGCFSYYFAYFPVRTCNTAFGACFVACAIADVVMDFTFLDLFIDVWLIIVGFVLMFIEWPRSFWNNRIQTSTFKWAKFTERLWGRAMLMFLFSVLCMSDTKSIIKILLGIPVFIGSIVNMILSTIAAKQLHRLHEYLIEGTEGENATRRLQLRFDEYDKNGMGVIGDVEIYKMLQDANRFPSKSELLTIVRFFDEGKSEKINKDEWELAWVHFEVHGVRFL